MGKKQLKKLKVNGNVRVIGLSKKLMEKPFTIYKLHEKVYVPDGAPKSLRDLKAHLEGKRYTAATPDAKNYLESIAEGRTKKYIRKLNVINVN